jgi:hypothetical protein
MDRSLISTLVAAAVVLAPGAALAAHGKAGLWTVTTTMANAPPIPPEALAQMKAHNVPIPTPGQPFTSQMCMTEQQVQQDVPPAMNNRDEQCSTKLLSQSPSAISAETTCHGRMDGVGRIDVNWRGNEHYEGTNSFKGTMEGRPHEMSMRFSGDFVKADCGSVRPYPVRPMQ